jgi:hypothetical protein
MHHNDMHVAQLYLTKSQHGSSIASVNNMITACHNISYASQAALVNYVDSKT